jgi:serpin B
MFRKNYQEAVNEIRTSQSLKEDTLEKMRRSVPVKRDFRRILAYGAAAVLVIMVTVTAGAAATKSTYATAISTPDYPKKLDFDDYSGRHERFEEIDPAFLNGLEEFSLKSSTLVLRDAGSSENRLFSPISLYLALAMVAESASGETQDEVLAALHMDSMDLVRSETGKLFRRLYTDNEIGRLSLGNSLWLSRDIAFNRSLLDILGKDYYAHSFSVDFRDASSAKSVSDWVSEQTGGKLGTSPSDFSFSKDEVMTLLSTIYFYDEWQDRFDPAKTMEAPFHLQDGTSVTADFMNITYFSHLFARGENYTVSSLNMKNQRAMVFILPDEGTSLEELLKDDRFLSGALTSMSSDQAFMGEVVFKVPKFNFTSSLELQPMAASIGMEQIFTDAADFSNLSATRPLFISSISQDATISIDEKGVEAAAFTEIHWVGSAQPEGRADMVLDKPFLFAITGVDGSPLFIGTLNNPLK